MVVGEKKNENSETESGEGIPGRPPCAIEGEISRFLSENLIRLRGDRQWTQRCAANTLGVAESTWSQWEKGKRFPPSHMLALLGILFGVPVCSLLFDLSAATDGTLTACPAYSAAETAPPDSAY